MSKQSSFLLYASVVEKVVLRMHGFLQMLEQVIFIYQQENIIWHFLHAMHFWCCIMASINHLREWQQANQRLVNLSHIELAYRPATHEELFNLHHASLCSCIKRISGIYKHKFRILQTAPEYNICTQAKIPLALAALHNFIHINDPNDSDKPEQELSLVGGPEDHIEQVGSGDLGYNLSSAEHERSYIRQDKIAEQI